MWMGLHAQACLSIFLLASVQVWPNTKVARAAPIVFIFRHARNERKQPHRAIAEPKMLDEAFVYQISIRQPSRHEAKFA